MLCGLIVATATYLMWQNARTWGGVLASVLRRDPVDAYHPAWGVAAIAAAAAPLVLSATLYRLVQRHRNGRQTAVATGGLAASVAALGLWLLAIVVWLAPLDF